MLYLGLLFTREKHQKERTEPKGEASCGGSDQNNKIKQFPYGSIKFSDSSWFWFCSGYWDAKVSPLLKTYRDMSYLGSIQAVIKSTNHMTVVQCRNMHVQVKELQLLFTSSIRMGEDVICYYDNNNNVVFTQQALKFTCLHNCAKL